MYFISYKAHFLGNSCSYCWNMD